MVIVVASIVNNPVELWSTLSTSTNKKGIHEHEFMEIFNPKHLWDKMKIWSTDELA